jgi:hypothetical protein
MMSVTMFRASLVSIGTHYIPSRMLSRNPSNLSKIFPDDDMTHSFLDDDDDVFGDPTIHSKGIVHNLHQRLATKQTTMIRTAASTLVLLLLSSLTANGVGAKQTEEDANTGEIMLEDFSNPKHVWSEMNDPVMGGRSTGTFTIDSDTGTAMFIGQVKDVPFLKAPGFIQARTTDKIVWPDVTSCEALELELRSTALIDDDEYSGYRVSFGTTHAPGGKFYAKGYKATLPMVVGSAADFEKIRIPFNEFTDFWDDLTGDPIHTCEENALYCPDIMTLKDMKTVAFWGEGIKGKVSLEIKAIRAVGCAESSN